MVDDTMPTEMLTDCHFQDSLLWTIQVSTIHATKVVGAELNITHLFRSYLLARK